ncbi:MAG: right-handed parallel beta-helix repeat-containing protein [Armatimonadota bacterium]|nr:MAG: right-handed parallel beta-helix repeat-containing protein [Armatimonadota bacterium]
MIPKRLAAVLTLALLAAGATAQAAETVFFVSPTGSDANPGSMAQPFATVARARDAVRALSQDRRGDVTVVLRGGTYHLTQPIRFDEQDSGGDDHPITYRNHVGEIPVLVAGQPVTGWQRHRGGVFKALVPGLKDGRVGITQLLEDGVPAAVARIPNEGWFRMADPELQDSFRYDPNDFDPGGWDASQLQVYLIMMGTYFSEYYPVERIDRESHRLYLGGSKPTDPAYNWKAGKTYIVQNALALLDAPGEFYADRTTGWLHYWPRAQDVGRAEIIAATAENVMRFEGTARSSPVRNIRVEGIRFEGSRGDQIYLRNADRIAIRDCRLLSAGGSGVAITGASTHVTVSGCEIAGCGNSGVNIRGEYEKTDGGAATVCNYSHVIHNNYIHHVGRLTITACGVIMSWSANDNVISHNLLTDIPKAGVLMFSMWDIPRAYGIMNNNTIRSNEFARCGSSSWDGGAFYIGATTDNTVFENNRITDVWSWLVATWPQPDHRPEDDCSIDFDPGMTFNTYVRNNVCYGENAFTVETAPAEDQMFLDNNYFDSPVPGRVLFNSVWSEAPPFDISKVSMDIGLTAEYKHPYPRETIKPVELPLDCGFEGTLSPLFLHRYMDGARQEFFTRSQVHDGEGALRVDKDVFVVRYRHPQPISRKVSIWLYDDPAKRNALCMVTLRGPWAAGESVAAMGVDGRVAREHYVVTEPWSGMTMATQAPRTVGWHELTFHVDHDRGCTMMLDGQVVGTAPLLKYFTVLDAGDAGLGSDSRGLGLDSLRIE